MEEQEDEVSPTRAPREPEHLVVGIGASAGGLEALKGFLNGLPRKPGFALILLQHVGETERHLLAEVFGRIGQIPAVEIEDNLRIEPDRLYLAPPNAAVTVKEDRFRLRPPRTTGERRNPIDRLFQSLADACGTRAVGIVMSGGGSDGALGLAAIAAAGGVTMAQAPETAAVADMPSSVAAASDHVLPPPELAATLVTYAQHWREVTRGSRIEERRREIQARLPEICDILMRRTGHDFKHYKASTLVRRLERRMQVLQAEPVDAYVGRLSRDLQEPHILFRELLIGVTSFFRDPEAFAAVAERAIATLLGERSHTDQIRIWVPGCATGEEAYSIAILILEQMERLEARPKVQIFATDVNERALATARRGSYPQGISLQVSPERLARYFVKRGRRYHVSDELRELCLFSVHNLIGDPPFSRLDLISCRNLLIYLGSHLQRKLIPVFHYALRPGGFLFLGASESLTGHGELFRVIDAKHRIAQRKDSPALAQGALRDLPSGIYSGWRGLNATPDADLGAVAQRILLDEFAPRYAIVTEDGQALYLSEGADIFVQAPSGTFSSNIMRMARRGLSVGLRTAFGEAIRRKRTVVRDISCVQTAEGPRSVRLTVQPMPDLGREDGLYMLAFQERGPPARRAEEHGAGGPEVDSLIDNLERELLRTREDLERTVQDLESANEELKSSNEELLSINEELQSANEELETSKEEVQVANQALAASHADLENLLRGTRIAAIFLDRDGAIRGFTPAAAEIYNIAAADLGRSLGHFTHVLNDPPPIPSLRTLQSATKPVEHEVTSEDGRWFLRRALAYRTAEGTVDGIVITFTDITRQKQSEEALREAERRQRFLLKLNDELRDISEPREIIRRATESLGRFLGINRVAYGEIDAGQRYINVQDGWTDGAIGSVAGRHRMEDFGEAIIGEMRHGRVVRIDDVAADPRTSAPGPRDAFAHIRTRALLALPLVKSGRFTAMLYFHHGEPHAWTDEEVALAAQVAERTWSAVERARAETALAESEERYRMVYDQAAVGIKRLRIEDGRFIEVNPRLCEMLGYSRDELLQMSVRDVTHPDDLPQENALFSRLVAGEIPYYVLEKRYRRADGRFIWVRVTSSIARSAGDQLYRISIVEDIDKRKEAETALAEHAQRLRLALGAARMGDWSWDAESDQIALSERAAEIFGLPPERQITWTAVAKLLHPEDAERARLAVEDALTNRTQYEVEYRIRRASDGTTAWIAAKGQGVYGAEQKVRGIIGVVQDITARKRFEERQSLLIRELHHRVKNTLATVQAIVGSTARTASGIDEFYRAFVGRIVSLAHTHSLLTDDEWQTVPLRKLLEDELRPYEEGGTRVRLDGPDVELPSDVAVPMGMAIHELTTNAAKYGALSRRGGRVEIVWHVTQGEGGQRLLRFVWTERDGPAVEPPTKQGFGSRLLERVLTTQLQAEVKIEFNREGLRLRMVAPLAERPSFLKNLDSEASRRQDGRDER